MKMTLLKMMRGQILTQHQKYWTLLTVYQQVWKSFQQRSALKWNPAMCAARKCAGLSGNQWHCVPTMVLDYVQSFERVEKNLNQNSLKRMVHLLQIGIGHVKKKIHIGTSSMISTYPMGYSTITYCCRNHRNVNFQLSCTLQIYIRSNMQLYEYL